MPRWKMVYQNPVRYKAHIVKGVLQEHGIQAIVMDQQPTSHPIANLGQAQVLVAQQEEAKALEIILEEIDLDHD